MIDDNLRNIIECLAIAFIIVFTMFIAFIIGYCELSGGWF
jgi:hypothetical protein